MENNNLQNKKSPDEKSKIIQDILILVSKMMKENYAGTRFENEIGRYSSEIRAIIEMVKFMKK